MNSEAFPGMVLTSLPELLLAYLLLFAFGFGVGWLASRATRRR